MSNKKSTNLINPTIQADDRITFLHTLPSARELHQYIQYLDSKYGVDSSDPDNTFGKIRLDDAIIKHGVDNTLFFAGISSYRPEDLRLPKYQAIPQANTVIVMNKEGQVGMAQSEAHLRAERIPITVEDTDLQKLVQLRAKFKEELELCAPAEPVFSRTELEKHNTYKDDKNKTIPFEDLDQYRKNEIFDRVLEQQGYATNIQHRLHTLVYVPDLDGKYNRFEVQYYRLKSNRKPYFSTTYRGWQSQEEMDRNHPAYTFYKKWDTFHLHNMTVEEWTEMKADLDKVYEQSIKGLPKHLVEKCCNATISYN